MSTIFNTIAAALMRGDRVAWAGFGSFDVVATPREGKTPTFKAGTILKEQSSQSGLNCWTSAGFRSP